MIRILAFGCGGVRGAPAACVLAAAMAVGVGFGARPAYAIQSAQQAGDVDATQPSDPADGAQAPGTEQQAAEPETEQPPQEQPVEPPDELPVEPAGEQPVEAATEQQSAEPGAELPADLADAEQPAGTFAAPAGLVFSYIKSGSGADFERVMSRLGAALASSEDEQQRQLASGWRVYRAQEPGPDGEVLYVWLIDPALAGADYAVPELLGAALPDESQALFDAFSEAFGSGQALINLEPVSIGPAQP